MDFNFIFLLYNLFTIILFHCLKSSSLATFRKFLLFSSLQFVIIEIITMIL